MKDPPQLNFKGVAHFETMREGQDENTLRITKNPTTVYKSAIVVDRTITIQFPISRRGRDLEIMQFYSWELDLRMKSWVMSHAVHDLLNLVGKDKLILIPPNKIKSNTKHCTLVMFLIYLFFLFKV